MYVCMYVCLYVCVCLCKLPVSVNSKSANMNPWVPIKSDGGDKKPSLVKNYSGPKPLPSSLCPLPINVAIPVC